MYLAVTIPEDLLGRLRVGAKKLLLAIVIEPSDDWEGEQSSRFCRVTRLLDAIGWYPGEAGPEVVIDIDDHAPALHEALVRALRDAVIELRALERGVTQNGIREFAELVDAASRQGGRQDIRAYRLSEQADELIAELDVNDNAFDPLADVVGACGPWRARSRLRGRLAGVSFLSNAARRKSRRCLIA